MNLPITFIETRARRTDPDTSKAAARHAASGLAAAQRHAIAVALHDHSMTAREVAEWTGIDYITVQRRIGECSGIVKTDVSRDGCRVWMAL